MKILETKLSISNARYSLSKYTFFGLERLENVKFIFAEWFIIFAKLLIDLTAITLFTFCKLFNNDFSFNFPLYNYKLLFILL